MQNVSAATVQKFTFKNEIEIEIRTVIKDGEPWFVAQDVCAALGLANTFWSVNGLDPDEKSYVSRTNLGLKPGKDMVIINESGLYAVIVRSDKPQARPFRKWVTSEVLPMIRKTGGTYMSAEAALEVIKDPRYGMGVLGQIKRQYIENGQLVVTVEIEKLPPKGQQFDVHTKTPRLAWTCFLRPDPFRVSSEGCFDRKAHPGIGQQIYTPGA